MAAERQSSQQTVRAWPQRTEMGQTAAWVLSLPELEMPDMLFVNQYYDPIDGRASVFVLEKVCRVGTGAEDEEIVPSKNSYRLKEFKPDELAQLPLPLVKKGGMSDCATVKSARRLLECRSNLTTQTNFVNRNFDQVVVSTAPPSRKASAVLPGGDGGEGVGGCDKASSGGGCNTPKSGNPANPFTSDTSENVYEPFIGEQAEPPFQDHSWSYDPHAPPNEEWGLVEEEHSVYSSEQQDAPRDVPPPSPVDQAPASVQAALYRAASAGCLPPPTILSNKRGTSEVTPAGTSAAKRACFKEPHTPGAGETTTLSPVGSGTSAGVLPVPGGGMSKGSGVLGKGFLSKQGVLLGKGGALHGTGPPAAVSTIAHQTLSGGAGPPAVSGSGVPKSNPGGDHFNLFPNQPVQTMSADYANSVAISVQRGSPGPIQHQVPPQHPGGHQPVAPAHQPATHPAPVLNSTVGGPCQLCITNFTCDAETILKEVQFHPSSVKKHQVRFFRLWKRTRSLALGRLYVLLCLWKRSSGLLSEEKLKIVQRTTRDHSVSIGRRRIPLHDERPFCFHWLCEFFSSAFPPGLLVPRRAAVHRGFLRSADRLRQPHPRAGRSDVA